MLYKVYEIYRIINAKIRLRKVSHLGKGVRFNGAIRIINKGGKLIIHDKVFISSDFGVTRFRVNKGATLEIGEYTGLTYGCIIEANSTIKIGRNALIGFESVIIDSDYHGIEDRNDIPAPQPITIEDNVWVGARCMILKGVTIGEGSVIGAGSLVTKSIPPRSLAVGSPARVIKTF
jgi:maltose O-acetyltransferase